MARIGYARVGTLDQDLETQTERLKAEGCATIRSEKVSGSSREGHTELAAILTILRPSDEPAVARLGRDTRDVLNLFYAAEQKGPLSPSLTPTF